MKKLIDVDEAYRVLTDYYHHTTDAQHKSLREALDSVPVEDAPQWIPCDKALPLESYITPGSGIQYSPSVLITVANCHKRDELFVDMGWMSDGEWMLTYPPFGDPKIPRGCEVIAWRPIPPYQRNGTAEAPKPVVIAEWVYSDKNGKKGWICSKCGFRVPWRYEYYGMTNSDYIRDYHVCPYCEAKMYITPSGRMVRKKC